MKILKGDITNVKYGVIIHQANDKRAMGKGVAKAITDKYPVHKEDYLNSEMKLGSVVKTNVNKDLSIVAMITQHGYGRDKNVRYTDYKAFEKALYIIKDMKAKNPHKKFYIPYKVGCCLGNGDWKIVSNLIRTICPFIILVRKDL